MLIISLTLNFLLISYLSYSWYKNRKNSKKAKHPQWVVDFYQQFNHAIKTNQSFTFPAKHINIKEWSAMYKGLTKYYNLPVGIIDIIGDDVMVVKPELYTGSRIKNFEIVMDYSPNTQVISLKEHSPEEIKFKVDLKKAREP